MATRKVTVTLEEAQVAAIRKLVAENGAASVSGFVKRAVDVALQDAAGWEALLAEALQRTGGPLTPKERRWADRVLGGKSKRHRAA